MENSQIQKTFSWAKTVSGVLVTLFCVATIGAWGAYLDVQRMKPQVKEALESKDQIIREIKALQGIICEFAISQNSSNESLKRACVRRN